MLAARDILSFFFLSSENPLLSTFNQFSSTVKISDLLKLQSFFQIEIDVDCKGAKVMLSITLIDLFRIKNLIIKQRGVKSS